MGFGNKLERVVSLVTTLNISKIPLGALMVLERLNSKGYESYFVGGCVRDSLLGREPKDWDITTKATPDEVTKVFKGMDCSVIPTGIKHGTVTVMVGKYPVEVTTFRSDGDYSDGRRPDSVQFGVTVVDDVLRRDFSINTLLFDGNNLIDYAGGYDCLENKVIRAVGIPNMRFKEDALRMLRAIRFSCQLGFTIHSETFESIKENCGLIHNVSWERIRDEFTKILVSERAVKGIEMLRESGLLGYILPELSRCYGFDQNNPNHHKDVYGHILKVIDSTPNTLNIRLAALLHDIGKPNTFSMGDDGVGHFYGHHMESAYISKSILQRFKFDNETIDNVFILVKEHMCRYPKLRDGSIKKLLRRISENNVTDLINLLLADIIGSKPPYDFESVIDLKREIERILATKEPLSARDLALNGNDIMEIFNLKPSPLVGKVLNHLTEYVLEFPDYNTSGILQDVASKYLKVVNS